MPKISVFITVLLLFLSSVANAQMDTLETTVKSAKPDSMESIRVNHHFLWWHTDTWYKCGIKRYKIVRRRRFLRNMFKRNRFDRLSNIKFKIRDENGRLTSKTTVKPYTSEGKRREVKYVYYPDGKLHSKSVKVKEGRLGLRRERLKEFDEKGKRVRQIS